MKVFPKLLERAKQQAAIYEYRTAHFLKARVGNVGSKKARGEATKSAAAKFGMSRRQIERIVSAWPAKHAKLQGISDSGWRQWNLRASILSWLTAKELARYQKLTPAEQALIVFPRINARVRKLEAELRDAQASATRKRAPSK